MNFIYELKYLSRSKIFFVICGTVFFIVSCSATKTSEKHNTTGAESVCFDFLSHCLRIENFIQTKEYMYTPGKHTQKLYIEFPYIINATKVLEFSNANQLSKFQQRKITQRLAKTLNDYSLFNYLHSPLNFSLASVKKIKKIAINNSALIFIGDNTLEESASPIDVAALITHRTISPKQASDSTENLLTIGLIDSGVSIKHERLESLQVVQYNPSDESYQLKDTALGHGTGILSLLALSPQIENSPIKQLPPHRFLSCNGLVGGRYDYLNILQCFDWLFSQQQAEVVVNAWLVNQPGCHYEWLYPIRMLWASNSIPIFSVGNYGEKYTSDYSPVNLSPLNDTPLVTVGALNQRKEKLASSSFGVSQCRSKRILPTIMAPGDSLEVAVPFTRSSYQKVEGTSYSVAFVGRALAHLISQYPKRSSQDIVEALLLSADDINISGPDQYTGYGELNLRKAVEMLELSQ